MCKVIGRFCLIVLPLTLLMPDNGDFKTQLSDNELGKLNSIIPK